MTRKDRITDILTRQLAPTHLELHDDSASHAGHAGAAPGGQTHYRLVVESSVFAGMNNVQRHQLVYRLLAEEFKTGLHALSIEARSLQ